ncbi:MAG: type II toxin-antitoxin system RelB/DinJ family antitoxin [Pseudobutyrivibrio sp.]|nr:type II toxin-antitoxin system RelB/DinJ family antitoxin [Pseudobutyrivibrio sp.]
MALSTITARVSDVDKSNFDSFCSSVGLTSSAAINMFVKAVLREHRIPFEIKQDEPFFSDENQAYVLKSVNELRAGKGTAHELIEVEDE